MEKGEVDFTNRFTSVFGFPSERAATKVRDSLTDPVRRFIEESPFLVMATSDREGRCDASPKGGKPGFVRVLDDRRLLVPDVAGNKLFQSYLNMDENPYVGLCFFIPGIADIVRVNGRISAVTREELDRHQVEESMYNPDGYRGVQQGIIVEIEESFGHCPRALSYSDFWDQERIQERRGTAHPVRMPPAVPSTTGS
jgi:PPOX class probable FMN-dependent enzyme